MQKGFWTKQKFIKELTPLEHVILWSDIGLVLVLFIVETTVAKAYGKWVTWVSMFASIVSIFSVMAGVKKKSLCPLLGVIGSALLMPVAWYNKLYATMTMFGINFVMQSISFFTWSKNADTKASVKPVDITWWQLLIFLIIILGLTALFTWIEGLESYNRFLQSEIQPIQIRIFDSGTLMFSIACCISMVLRLKIVWGMYILNDSCQLATWICKIAMNPRILNNWVMLVNVLGLLATSILGFVRWYKNK